MMECVFWNYFLIAGENNSSASRGVTGKIQESSQEFTRNLTGIAIQFFANIWNYFHIVKQKIGDNENFKNLFIKNYRQSQNKWIVALSFYSFKATEN